MLIGTNRKIAEANPGLFTSIFGLLPVSVFYLSKTFGMHIYTGTMPDYEFTTEEVYRAKKYIDKFK